MLKITSDADKMYAGYAGTRPNYRVPTQPAELLSLREPVFRKHYLPLLPVERDARILDLGCGYGEFSYFLQRHGYTNAGGVDLSDRQLEVGRSLGVWNLQCGDAAAVLAESSGEFDFISAIDVLEHIPKNQVLGLLTQIYSALRPGGRFLCQVPNLAAFYSPMFYMDFTHETPFTAPSLKQALQLAHFDDIRVLPMGPVAHGIKSAVRSVLWKGITTCLRFVQTVEGGPQDALSSIYTAAILASADKSGLLS
jgi:2-polyprenyl-3-methyl-5-hydroxy-6-metoxy-1,4-benzoquinol methylase